jgi:SAM-dependent methyltransferase
VTDTVERFSNRVENYVKFRPSYPPELLALFRDKMDLTAASVIADIGSGPGTSARMFLENGNVVYGVEPNNAMRSAAEQILGEYPNFRSIKGTAEASGLGSAAIDIVTAAQAFHWFDVGRTKTEFRRILNQGGWVALIWNERQLETNDFHREYERFLVTNANDYAAVRHDKITLEEISGFFDRGSTHVVYDNRQVLDFDGLRGRMFSSSYMPPEDTDRGRRIEKALYRLFTKYAEGGKIEILYDTNIFYGRL